MERAYAKIIPTKEIIRALLYDFFITLLILLKIVACQGNCWAHSVILHHICCFTYMHANL